MKDHTSRCRPPNDADVGFYCTVYVHADVTLNNLLEYVSALIDGRAEFWTAKGSGLEIAVEANDEFDEGRAAGGAGDFLYFPYRLEVEEVEPHLDRGEVRAMLVQVLEGLRRRGFDFVTAADFEDDLPHRGRSRDLHAG